ncbi:SOS response-associated peptidase family protein [Paenarthrobacter nitroguajacolicus]
MRAIFAGLYEFWPDPELPEDDPERWMLTCAVLTTTSQDALGHVRDRSPVVIPKHLSAEWLDPDLTDKADVQHLKESPPELTLTPRIVTTRVNSTGQQRPELMNQLRGGSAGKMTSSGHP